MKPWLLFLSLLLIFRCQSDTNIESYYVSINQAEQDFYNQEYHKSFNHYKKAFDIHKPFGQDCISGIVVARKIGRLDFVKKWMSYGVRSLGFTQDFYKKCLLLKGIDKTSIWREFNAHYDMDRAHFINTQNTIFLSSIQKLVEEDQGVRSRIYKTNVGAKEIAEIRNVDSLAMQQFIALVNKHNFPSEKNCGVNINAGYLDYPKYDVLLLHFCQQGWWKQLEPILKKALLSGTLNNEQYAKYADFAYENSHMKELDFYGYMLIGKCDSEDQYYLLNMDRETIINKNRSKIFLDDLRTAQNKWIRNHLCQKDFLMSKQNVSLLSLPDFLCDFEKISQNSFTLEESCTYDTNSSID